MKCGATRYGINPGAVQTRGVVSLRTRLECGNLRVEPMLTGRPIMLGAYLNLDNAWNPVPLGLETVDALSFGPALRYHASRLGIERFFEQIVKRLPPLVLYGSGDFHHLSSCLLRRWAGEQTRPMTLLSFDNHPDWDIRPPVWACGGWINRSLELPNVASAHVWGCGNFELGFPARLFRNRRALSERRLNIHAWAERQSPSVQKRFNCMTRDNWRDRFTAFVQELTGQSIYVTVDLDCLTEEEMATNWENGLFSSDDIVWAIGLVREHASLIAADVCGSRSEPIYARAFQRFAAKWDHPKLPPMTLDKICSHNQPAVEKILCALNL